MLGRGADCWHVLAADEQAYFDGWLSYAPDEHSYCFVDGGTVHDDWVDVQSPIPTIDFHRAAAPFKK